MSAVSTVKLRIDATDNKPWQADPELEHLDGGSEVYVDADGDICIGDDDVPDHVQTFSPAEWKCICAFVEFELSRAAK